MFRLRQPVCVKLKKYKGIMNMTIQPKLHFEFELENEIAGLYIKLPMHIFQSSHILGKIKIDYIWIIGSGKERR